MLFAMSQIVFFLLLASLLGGAAGWWLARSGRISVTAAMDRSGAHAAADRELESARAEIDRLQAKLAITTEAIRELETGEVATEVETPSMSEFAEPASLVEFARTIPAVPGAPVELRAVEDHDQADEPEASAAEDAPAHVAIDVEDDAGSNDFAIRSVRDKGGKRLSDRVAEASTLSRPDREEPTIKFEDSDG
jgi:hypothetical protein